MNPNSLLLSGSCSAAEKTINKVLRYDPGSRHSLAPLKGRVFAIEVNDLKLTVYLILADNPDTQPVSIHSHYDGTVDCTLTGDWRNLLSLLFSKEKQNLLNSGVSVSGDIGLLMALTQVSRELDIDWEEAINDTTGEWLGQPLNLAIRKVATHLKKINTKLPMFIGDYLTEELQAIPSESELQHFYSDVGKAGSHLNRLEQRIERLTKHLSGH